MSSQRYKVYQEFTKQYVVLFSGTGSSRERLFSNAQAEWNKIKHDDKLINEKLKEYCSANMKRRGTLMSLWSKQKKTSATLSTILACNDLINTSPSSINETSEKNRGHQEIPSTPNPGAAALEHLGENTEVEKSFKTPAQRQRTNELMLVKDKLNKLYSLRSSGLLTDDNKKNINSLEKQQKNWKRIYMNLKKTKNVKEKDAYN